MIAQLLNFVGAPQVELFRLRVRIRSLGTSPSQANAICERWIGSARRECLDFMIPISEVHCWGGSYEILRFAQDDIPYDGLVKVAPHASLLQSVS